MFFSDAGSFVSSGLTLKARPFAYPEVGYGSWPTITAR